MHILVLITLFNYNECENHRRFAKYAKSISRRGSITNSPRLLYMRPTHGFSRDLSLVISYFSWHVIAEFHATRDSNILFNMARDLMSYFPWLYQIRWVIYTCTY